jgi:hypothetical protein
MTDPSGYAKTLALPAGFDAPRLLGDNDVTAHAITRDDLAADVRGINANLDLSARPAPRGRPVRSPRRRDYVDLVRHECEFPDGKSFTFCVEAAAAAISAAHTSSRVARSGWSARSLEVSSCWAAWWRRSRSAARRSPRSWLLSLRRLVVAIGYLMCRWPARVAGRSPTPSARRAQNLGGDGPSPGPQPDCHESLKQAPDDLRFGGSPPAGRRIGCRTFTRCRARFWRGALLNDLRAASCRVSSDLVHPALGHRVLR